MYENAQINLFMSEKLTEKFLAAKLGYSMEKLPISTVFSQKFLNWKEAQEVNHCRKDITKREKGKANEQLKKAEVHGVGHFLHFLFMCMPKQKCSKCDVSGKKGILICCKYLFD